MTTKEVGIKLKPDVQEAKTAFEGFSANLVTSLAGAVAGLGVLKAAWSGVVDFIKSGLELAGKQRESEELLAMGMKRRGDATGAAFTQLKQYNDELSRKYAIDTTELSNLERSLTLHGVRNDALAGATKATIGLATVTGGDLGSAGDKVARILEGNIGFLKKLGIEAKSSEEAILKLSQIAATDSVDKLNTYQGKVQQLGADWTRFKEALFQKTGDEKDSFAFRAVDAVGSVVRRLTRDVQDAKSGLQDLLAGTAALTAGFFDVRLGKAAFDALKADAPQDPATARDGRDPREMRAGLDADANARLAARKADRERNQKAAAAAEKKALEQLKKDDKAREEQEKAWLARMKAAHDAKEKLNQEQLKTEEEYQKKLGALKQSQAEYDARLDDERFEASISTLSSQQQERARLIRSGVDLELVEVKRRNQTIEDLQSQAAQIGASGMANTVAGMAKAAGEGKGQLDKVLASLVGGVIVQMGTMLIQLGTAGVLAGTLGSLIPAFAALTGGPLGVGAGLAAIAGGAAMVALGSAMGGSGGGSSATSSSSSGGSSGAAAQRSYGGPGTVSSQPPVQPAPQTIVVHFDQGVIAAEPRPFARKLRDYLSDADLSIGWAR